MLDDISGVYRVEIKTPMGIEKAILTLKASNNRLQGNLKSSNAYSEFINGMVEKNNFKFDGTIKKILLNIEYLAIGKVEDNKLTAKITTKYGVFYASGVKI
ncbi:hypothetical protein [uncultured Clostridium sp.]|uniref:hypothetical protein n=1 Tax=uncultured Clostridium sp. TaxID=59620 RepID=UPI002601012B|nr:hypothetical protein [uncultured Clostridium sp.]